MKKWSLIFRLKQMMFVAALVLLVFLAGCGGGGNDGTTATTNSTSTGKEVNLKVFNSINNGSAATGSQISFTVTGTDDLGHAVSGSITTISDGATTFEGHNVTKSRNIVTLALSGSSARTTSSTSYFLTSNGAFYKKVSSSGVISLPSTQYKNIPDIAKVGDTGQSNTTASDGTKNSETWKLETDSNNNFKLTVSAVIKNASDVVTATGVETYYIDSTGKPYKYTSTTTAVGRTLTLSGNGTFTVFQSFPLGTWVGSSYSGNTQLKFTITERANSSSQSMQTCKGTITYGGGTITVDGTDSSKQIMADDSYHITIQITEGGPTQSRWVNIGGDLYTNGTNLTRVSGTYVVSDALYPNNSGGGNSVTFNKQ